MLNRARGELVLIKTTCFKLFIGKLIFELKKRPATGRAVASPKNTPLAKDVSLFGNIIPQILEFVNDYRWNLYEFQRFFI